MRAFSKVRAQLNCSVQFLHGLLDDIQAKAVPFRPVIGAEVHVKHLFLIFITNTLTVVLNFEEKLLTLLISVKIYVGRFRRPEINSANVLQRLSIFEF